MSPPGTGNESPSSGTVDYDLILTHFWEARGLEISFHQDCTKPSSLLSSNSNPLGGDKTRPFVNVWCL